VAEELGPDEVVFLCEQAWRKIGAVLTAAHSFVGWSENGPDLPAIDVYSASLVTETDVDPGAPERWGWI
jgi:hypothetical protein